MKVEKKKFIYGFTGSLFVIGVITYFLMSMRGPHITKVFELVNGSDTLCCTLGDFPHHHKTGSSHSGVDVRSVLTGNDKTLCDYTTPCELSCSLEQYLGYSSNGFVWFMIREKPVLVYLFKKDSVLDMTRSMQLLNATNPGTKLASIGYAPTASVVYAHLTNGDEMIIDPISFHYVLPTTEKESYRYGLSGKSTLYRDNIDLNDSQQVVLENNSASNIGLDLVKKTYSVKNGFFDSLRTSEGLVFIKFIDPYFSILKGNILLIQHRDLAGPESKPMISTFDLASNRMLWSGPVPFEIKPASDPLLFDALSNDYFYAVNTNKLFKINIKTGKLVL